MRQITDDTMKVAYAVRLSFIGGQAELEEIDKRMQRVICDEFPDDPLLRITRGELVPMADNPYSSAGFLHDGGPRAGGEPGPALNTAINEAAQRSRGPLKMNCTHKGSIHNASCVRND